MQLMSKRGHFCTSSDGINIGTSSVGEGCKEYICFIFFFNFVLLLKTFLWMTPDSTLTWRFVKIKAKLKVTKIYLEYLNPTFYMIYCPNIIICYMRISAEFIHMLFGLIYLHIFIQCPTWNMITYTRIK